MIETTLRQSFQEVLAIADPRWSLPRVLAERFPQGIQGRCLVVGAGKAGAAMADALERFADEHWPNAEVYGHVVTRYGHDVVQPLPKRKIIISQASHPLPDTAGLQASQEIYALVEKLQKNDLCIALISGGGSSLLPLPAGQLQLEQIQKMTQALLRCGARIEEINVLRKHVSGIQGGRLGQLAASRGAEVHAFIISDVVGDDATDIASGPFAADPTTYADAIDIMEKYGLQQQPDLQPIYKHLQQGQLGLIPETLKAHDRACQSINNEVFATAQKGLDAAAKFCTSQGYTVHLLGDQITGESRDFATMQANLVREAFTGSPQERHAWISGGETTVTIPTGISGRGGRCTEFLLALMKETLAIPGVSALAADTDGIDGSENNAGAFFHSEIRQRYFQQALSIDHYLASHNAYAFFSQLQSLVQTGPTLTNVNDFRIVLLEPSTAQPL